MHCQIWPLLVTQNSFSPSKKGYQYLPYCRSVSWLAHSKQSLLSLSVNRALTWYWHRLIHSSRFASSRESWRKELTFSHTHIKTIFPNWQVQSLKDKTLERKIFPGVGISDRAFFSHNALAHSLFEASKWITTTMNSQQRRRFKFLVILILSSYGQVRNKTKQKQLFQKQKWMQGWQYREGLIYLRPIFQCSSGPEEG